MHWSVAGTQAHIESAPLLQLAASCHSRPLCLDLAPWSPLHVHWSALLYFPFLPPFLQAINSSWQRMKELAAEREAKLAGSLEVQKFYRCVCFMIVVNLWLQMHNKQNYIH